MVKTRSGLETNQAENTWNLPPNTTGECDLCGNEEELVNQCCSVKGRFLIVDSLVDVPCVNETNLTRRYSVKVKVVKRWNLYDHFVLSVLRWFFLSRLLGWKGALGCWLHQTVYVQKNG